MEASGVAHSLLPPCFGANASYIITIESRCQSLELPQTALITACDRGMPGCFVTLSSSSL